MVTRLALAIVVAAGLAASVRTAVAAQPCQFLPVACVYEGLPFEIRVVDAATQQPVADVHGLAEWRMYGPGSRLDGPVMVQDALSGPDGVLRFPAWGPVEGYSSGLGMGHDPIVTLFKTGYKVLLIGNTGDRASANERERVRRFYQDRRTFVLEPFDGPVQRRLDELGDAAFGLAVSRSDAMTLSFRGPYLNRLRRVSSERDKLPSDVLKPGGLFWHIDRELKFLEEGRR